MNDFQQERQTFYSQLNGFWHDLFGEEYALWDVKVESKKNIDRIRRAADQIGHILFKTAPLLRQLDDDTLRQLGFPDGSLEFIRLHPISMESVIARLDLAVTKEEIKLLEVNADTPTFIKECFSVNGHVCRAFQLLDPNDGCETTLRESLQQAIKASFRSLGIGKVPNIVFTSHHDHDEDRLTTLYLKELCGIPSQYISLNDLRLIPDTIRENGQELIERGLYDLNGEKIDVLYRQTYPVEHLVEDRDPETNEKVGLLLMKLIKEKELAILNPPSAFLLQSKAVMAMIWGLHETNSPFYTDEEHHWIHTYFLPTYLDDDLFLERGTPYVKKPSFGREGDTVEIYSGNGEKVDEDRYKTYIDSLPVFQKFTPLPVTTIKTENGSKQVHYMYGCFYLNGQSSAIGIRAGRQITDNESYFLPVGILNEEEK
ncbi:glutathionylspermidine synthase family protein [Niallia sp. Krafla_26]|uniref:glutathionylspermidine synthase family protein n=1 Tax=Niallia sp. Krafla_26 TaxID=3064703 RepID=UPI003D170781